MVNGGSTTPRVRPDANSESDAEFEPPPREASAPALRLPQRLFHDQKTAAADVLHEYLNIAAFYDALVHASEGDDDHETVPVAWVRWSVQVM